MLPPPQAAQGICGGLGLCGGVGGAGGAQPVLQAMASAANAISPTLNRTPTSFITSARIEKSSSLADVTALIRAGRSQPTGKDHTVSNLPFS
jgi:hypothetical protein